MKPDFYLTAAGEYEPLAEPRACWVKKTFSDSRDGDCLLVELRPSVQCTGIGREELSLVVLTPRHCNESLVPINSWPRYVYVSYILDSSHVDTARPNKSQLEIIAWARLYPSIEGAARDFNEHAAAVGSLGKPERHHADELRFLGEQDGDAERILKEHLTTLLQKDERIWKAYLARVESSPQMAVNVTLCLRTVAGPLPTVVDQVQHLFASLFRRQQSLDVLFLTPQQDRDIGNVCKAFYVRTLSRAT